MSRGKSSLIHNTAAAVDIAPARDSHGMSALSLNTAATASQNVFQQKSDVLSLVSHAQCRVRYYRTAISMRASPVRHGPPVRGYQMRHILSQFAPQSRQRERNRVQRHTSATTRRHSAREGAARLYQAVRWYIGVPGLGMMRRAEDRLSEALEKAFGKAPHAIRSCLPRASGCAVCRNAANLCCMCGVARVGYLTPAWRFE